MYIEPYSGLYDYTYQFGVYQPTKHYLFVTWRMMNVRCYDTRHKAYHRYVARGIGICQEWRWDNKDAFKTFLTDIGERPIGLTLDRIDNNKEYSKENCKWSDKKTQQNNLGLGLTNKSGTMGVCFLENSWVVQLTLLGSTKMIGVFNKNEYDLAKERYEIVKKVKLEKGDEAAFEFADSLDIKTPTNKRLRRNKTSNYYGVHLCTRSGLWIAATTYRTDEKSPIIHKHLGRFVDQKEAYNTVLNFIKWVEDNGFYKKKI